MYCLGLEDAFFAEEIDTRKCTVPQLLELAENQVLDQKTKPELEHLLDFIQINPD